MYDYICLIDHEGWKVGEEIVVKGKKIIVTSIRMEYDDSGWSYTVMCNNGTYFEIPITSVLFTRTDSTGE